MADRIEREIEEILAKLDVGGESDTITGERTPTPIAEHRRARSAASQKRSSWSLAGRTKLNPATLLLTGAAVMVFGLIAANWWEPFIWLSFAGVVLFIAAFAWSFRARPANSGSVNAGPRQVYWRDRYIDMSPSSPNSRDRIRRFFRRR